MADKKKGKAKPKSKITRTKMTESEAEKFLSRHLKYRDLKGKLADEYVRRHAATRLAALERYAKKHAA